MVALQSLSGLWGTSQGRERLGWQPQGCRQEGSAPSHRPQSCICRD